MASFGEELRRERELRDISLKEISEATKISIRFLEGLEQNNFDMLPGGVFNRGFVRAYARFIGVDAEEMVNAYLHEVSLREARRSRGEDGTRSRGIPGTGHSEREASHSAGLFRPENRPLGGSEAQPAVRRKPEREFIPTLSRVEKAAPPPEASGRGAMTLWVLAAVVVAVGAGLLAVSFIPSRDSGESKDRLNKAREARLSQKAGGSRATPTQPSLDSSQSAAGAPAAEPLLIPSSEPAPPQPLGAGPGAPGAIGPAGADAVEGPPTHVVQIRAIEVTRVQIECAGKLTLDQELWPNQMKRVDCQEPVMVSADNAGAVLMSLDGGPDSLLGNLGERVEGRQIAPSLIPDPPPAGATTRGTSPAAAAAALRPASPTVEHGND